MSQLSSTHQNLRFGAFLAPYHFPGGNPTLSLRRDLDIATLMDELGYAEIYFGEHHSGGVEIVSSPEVMLAAAAERTKRIRLGTGVASVPYHHPLMLADRIALLDHLTGGRVILGVGPGALVADAHMMGIPVEEQRHRLEQGFEAVMRLLHDDEPVTMETDWFVLRDAKLNLSPVQFPRLETAVASVRSPSGPRLAGRFGSGMLSLAATDPTGGFAFLEETWDIASERAVEFGQTIDRADWRLVSPMHIAETEEQAREQAKFGFANFLRIGATGPFAPAAAKDVEQVLAESSLDDLIDQRNASGAMVIGTPEMARAQIERMWKQTGGFGCFLIMIHELATYEHTRRSLKLFAEQVMPAFQHKQARPAAGWDKLFNDRKSASGEYRAAQDKAIAEHEAEGKARGRL